MPPLPRRPPQQPQRVREHAARRRGERAEQGVVVERVGDDAEQPPDVVDLLLRPVAASADNVRRQPRSLQLVLERGDVGERAQQHDHVSGGDTLSPQFRQASGEEPGLRDPVRRRGVLAARGDPELLVLPLLHARRQQQLDLRAVAERVGGSPPPGDGQRPEAVQQRPAEEVRGGDHARDRAEVAAQLQQLGAVVSAAPGPGRARAGTRAGRRGGSRRSTGTRRRPRTYRVSGPASARISDSCSSFVSWNSSTIRCWKRSRYASAIPGRSRSSRTASCWRSSKSSPDRSSFSAAYRSPNSRTSSVSCV